MLRLAGPNVHTVDEIRSELWWLQAIARDTDLLVPQPVPTLDAELLVTPRSPGVPDTYHCTLFTWVGGRKPARPPSRGLARRMGIALARLHDHTETLPACFTRERIDTVWTFGRPDALYSSTPHSVL